MSHDVSTYGFHLRPSENVAINLCNHLVCDYNCTGKLGAGIFTAEKSARVILEKPCAERIDRM